jgi:hypothetical protein
MFTTTRQVGIGSNGRLNAAFHNFLFKETEEGSKPAIGDVVKNAKNSQNNDENKLRFVFLGDPALKLIYPDEKINITEIINVDTKEVADTLKALSHIKLSGNIVTRDGKIMDDFTGIAEINIYDKLLKTSTLGNGSNERLPYEQYSNYIFSGRASVNSGVFSFEFIVPHDIRHNYDKGKINLLAYSTDKNDRRQAAGATTDIIIGGFDENAGEDEEGPEITLYLNHESFKDGEKTGSSPLLFAKIEDESGLNVGNGIGHDIILIIDGDIDNTVVLNSYFTGDLDNFKSGMVIYQLPELSAGKHELTFKTWDAYNNSSIAKLSFVVGKDNELKIMNFALYPVPVQRFGTINYSFEIDEPNSSLNVSVDGINSAGQITGNKAIDIVSYRSYVEETQLPLSSIGINNPGLYFIRFVITTNTGKKGQMVKKIIVKP